MDTKEFIPVNTLCTHHKVTISFFNELHEVGLISIELFEETPYLHSDHLIRVESIVRIYKELNVNIEGIDVIFNLLERIKTLEDELETTQNKLLMYKESGHF